MGLKITKGDLQVIFPFRDNVTEEKYLIFENGGGRKYIDLTSNIEHTSFNKIHCNINGRVYYLKNIYFHASQQFEQIIDTYRIFNGNNPNPWEITKTMYKYNNITIGINSNIVLSGIWDRSGSSTNENYRWKWKFYNMQYDYYHSSENDNNHLTRPIPMPNNLDLSSVENLKISAEWHIDVRRSDLSKEWREIWSKSYSGGGRTITIKISAYINSNDILHVKFETFTPGTGGRGSATCGKYIKIGIITY